ncbi:GyrI-like domain-containing protein [Shewanella sp. WPAGA9]|uniref:GyrI-like domain-containing protein n=1 Tax=Shewanella sp. ENK2 TaxID=2775245 RepID=UPI001CDB97BE|nr:GyrI-like domain-containing protein [Shewanella sp. WPAGA9]
MNRANFEWIMEKVDYKKQLKHLYLPSKKQVTTVDVPSMYYLMVDGKGEPGSEQYQQAIEALYSVAYTIKFMIKKGATAIDYGVLPLEGLWWADDMDDFINDNKHNWQWTMMSMQPELVDKKLVIEAISQVKQKKSLAAIDLVRYESFSEGQCAQILHLGPFSEEGPTVAKVHDYIESAGFTLSGKHHEIYLSDIRRAAPENWKTVIRQPYQTVG